MLTRGARSRKASLAFSLECNHGSLISEQDDDTQYGGLAPGCGSINKTGGSAVTRTYSGDFEDPDFRGSGCGNICGGCTNVFTGPMVGWSYPVSGVSSEDASLGDEDYGRIDFTGGEEYG